MLNSNLLIFRFVAGLRPNLKLQPKHWLRLALGPFYVVFTRSPPSKQKLRWRELATGSEPLFED